MEVMANDGPTLISDNNADAAGFHTIYVPNEVIAGSRELDIIAIHGEGGDWQASWTSPNGFFWLRDAIPATFPYARVASYHYRADGRARESLVNTLLLDLIDYRTAANRLQVPIVFIAHSFGGTVVKQLFVATSSERKAKNHIAQLHSYIRGLAFFGTLHSGDVKQHLISQLTTLQRVIPRSSSIKDRTKTLLRLFEQLPSINEDFNVLGGGQIPAICFFELRKTKFSHVTQGIEVASREQSTLPSAIENRGLDTNHSDLNKFESITSQSLRRVLGSMGRLIETVMVWRGVITRSINVTNNVANDVNILSLDGGGVRGLFSIIVLETLMEAVRRVDAPEVPDALKPCDYFNLICGTSTGGLLAIMLGRLRMDLRSCKQAYKALSREIFKTTGWKIPGKKWWDAFRNKPWYSGDALEFAVQSILEEHISDLEKENLQLGDISLARVPLRPHHAQLTRCFVCATVQHQTRAERLRSYVPFGNEASPFTICEASRATSAAPLYFPPITVAGKEYYDGGMASNNPILEAIREAKVEFEGHNIGAVVSIGTGACQIVAPNTGLLSVINHMASRVTDTEEKWEQFLELFPLEDVSFRFQEKSTLGSIDLASSDRLDDVKNLARAYVATPRVRAHIENCAKKIARTQ